MNKVLKFGGSSVADAPQIRQVIDIIINQDEPCIVVVSAFGGLTDQLKALARAALVGEHDSVISTIAERHHRVAKALLDDEAYHATAEFIADRIQELTVICQGVHMLQELSARSEARMMSFGELLSSFIIAEALRAKMPTAVRIDMRDLIKTDDQLLHAAVIRSSTDENIRERLANISSVAVVPGFIASTTEGVTSLLGRGGSDYTASLIAAALDVDHLHIYSDVSGMLSANPKFVPNTQSISSLSYNEAFELSHFGAKVLYPPAIKPAYEKDIPLVLKNTFEPDHPGTTISRDVVSSDKIVTGISCIDEIAMVNLSGIAMIGVAGYSQRVFSSLHRAGVNVIMIAQSCSERGICVAVDHADLLATERALQDEFAPEITMKRIDPIRLEEDLSIVALVGDGMQHRSGVSGQVFSVLGDYGINVRAVAQGSSESNISIIIESKDEKRALQKLHEYFFEAPMKTAHLFICGVGTVGKAFIDILNQVQQSLEKNLGIKLMLQGISNSRNMILSEDAISFADALEKLEKSNDKADLMTMANFAKVFPAPNKIFIDNTASNAVSSKYHEYLGHGIHVVTCNKIAASGDLGYFQWLGQLQQSEGTAFHYETNVGAALPMIQTVADMTATGDTIHRIEAVLSGSLNYIFNHYDGKKSFSDVVSDARDLGYTEPHPLTDLSGLDVARKIVILSRAAGQEVSLEDVSVLADLPAGVTDHMSADQFIEALKSDEIFFRSRLDDAMAKSEKLKYIASYSSGKLEVGVRQIDENHPFYGLSGTDNMLAIYSDRYPENPLVIRGAGAGPEQTASGVLADVLKILN